MSTEENKAVIRRYIEELNRRNEAVIDELIPDDFTAGTLHATPDPAGEDEKGPGIVRRGYRRNIETFPDYHVTIQELVAEGDRVVMHWVYSGTHSATFHGVPATGKVIRGAAVSIYRVVDGKIQDVRALWDSAEVWSQLGIIPESGIEALSAPKDERR